MKGGAILNPKGRPVGAKNKNPTAVVDMVMTALKHAGANIKKEEDDEAKRAVLEQFDDGAVYLLKVAENHPQLFIPLVGKLMPTKVDLEVNKMGAELLQLMTERRDQLAKMKDVTPDKGDDDE